MAVMARYEQSYAGERRTSALRVQLTPSERAHLEAVAARVGAQSLSHFVRTLCLRRVAVAERVAGTRRHPEARQLIYELSAIGNNLNQLTRISNSIGALHAVDDLYALIGELKAAIARVIAL